MHLTPKSEVLLKSRRRFLSTAAAFALFTADASARSISGALPWSPFAADPPKPVNPVGWLVLTPQEAATVEAMVDRLIPADHLSPGGKECGCAIFIDRQLAGSFGNSSNLYTKGPFAKGLPSQGYQDELTPIERYSGGLRALNDHAHAAYGQDFSQLPTAAQDEILTGLESGKIDLKLTSGMSTKAFFELLLQNTMEGFFADPVYGGNRGMASWKMLGFPGARYDYRDYIDKHDVAFPFGPVAIVGGEASWTAKG